MQSRCPFSMPSASHLPSAKRARVRHATLAAVLVGLVALLLPSQAMAYMDVRLDVVGDGYVWEIEPGLFDGTPFVLCSGPVPSPAICERSYGQGASIRYRPVERTGWRF